MLESDQHKFDKINKRLHKLKASVKKNNKDISSFYTVLANHMFHY